MASKRVFEELCRRYGIPVERFHGLALVDHESDVFVTTPEVAAFERLKPVRKGIRLARVFTHGIKPTTNAIQLFGSHATRNCIELDPEQVHRFIRGETVELSADCPCDPGFVIVRHQGFAVGVGLYKPGALKSQVPLSRRVTPRGPETATDAKRMNHREHRERREAEEREAETTENITQTQET